MIRDIKSGQSLTARQLARRLAAASHVLVGEQHDNPDHHAVQLWLLQALTDYRPQGSLLLEMLTSSQQASVDGLQAGMRASSYPADLAAALNWRPAWDWLMFGPILRFALAQPYRVLAAGLDPGHGVTVPEHMTRCVLAAPVPTMLFAEAGWVRKATGLPVLMASAGPGIQPVVLMLARVGDHIAPDTADYVWYCAAHP
ncbi:iron(III) ABC transporter [Pseudomonas sp. v388]|uniref:ChaN family lipoprotein n=1 Tax=Pseudomonas sp. v388 TaxID=2479849 RepID=UPI000F7B1786|nr:ChaN family lipoprotein [Pseudomonas sp. v388]RRV04078.1 iron(III) ABC transporter [Pseudomonas sp. v388]